VVATTRSFLRRDADAQRFWDVSWEDLRVEITSGKWRTNGRSRHAVFDSTRERDAFLSQEIQKVLAKGYAESCLIAPPAPDKAATGSLRAAASLRKRIEALVRPAWLPAFENGSEHPSRFGTVRGPMTLAIGEEWPRCARCGNELSALLEFDLRDVPATHLRADALVQLFWCEAWERDGGRDVCIVSGGYLARRRQRSGSRTDGPATVHGARTPSSIVGWTEIHELPLLCLTELGGILDEADPAVIDALLRAVHIDDLDYTTVSELDGAAVYEKVANKLGVAPQNRHKLGGHPTFVQQYGDPPFVEQVFQIEQSAPFDANFGDVGAAHLLALVDGSIGLFWSGH
jgi:predicted DNA-binding WGR domain protein